MKLEAMGYDVGYRFAERAARDKPRMLAPLDVIKFVCKEFWIAIFNKQIDKLQTNHRGVFVVQDFSFRWVAGISAATEHETKEMALLFLVFPCGLIRGALANLGLTAIVNGDVPDVRALPGCTCCLCVYGWCNERIRHCQALAHSCCGMLLVLLLLLLGM